MRETVLANAMVWPGVREPTIAISTPPMGSSAIRANSTNGRVSAEITSYGIILVMRLAQGVCVQVHYGFAVTNITGWHIYIILPSLFLSRACPGFHIFWLYGQISGTFAGHWEWWPPEG